MAGTNWTNKEQETERTVYGHKRNGDTRHGDTGLTLPPQGTWRQDRWPPGRCPFWDQRWSRELRRPWWSRELGRPRRVWGFHGPWQAAPPPTFSWGDRCPRGALEARTPGGAQDARTLGGAQGARTLGGTQGAWTLGGALEWTLWATGPERALEWTIGAFPLHGMVRHGTVRYGSLLGGFPLGTVPGTWYFFSTTSVEVPSEPYRYQNVTCKLCWSLIGRRKSSLLRHWTCDTRPSSTALPARFKSAQPVKDRTQLLFKQTHIFASTTK